MASNPDHESIFGDTYRGVPNPQHVHRHPWPTRYHGPIFRTPMAAGFTYRENPFEVARGPMSGMGDCGCKKSPDGIGLGMEQSPDGVGFFVESTSLTGSRLVDALLGAGFGAVVAPSPESMLKHALVSAIASGLFGAAGLCMVAGGELVIAHHEGRLDSVLAHTLR